MTETDIVNQLYEPVAVAAGLGRMGLHRNVIHPVFGSFVLLNTVLIEADMDEYNTPLDYNPCLGCRLCSAACPTSRTAIITPQTA